MASIRRTLSPAYADRGRLNGTVGSTLSPSFPKLLTPTAKTNGVYGSKQRKGLIGRRSLYRCLLFFVLGVVLGASPLGHVGRDIAEAQAHDIDAVSLRRELEIRPPRADATRDEFANILVAASARKLLIVVTPTYVRAAQAYFLSRIGQALTAVAPPVVWVVVEAGEGATVETAEVLRRTGLMYRHLATGRKEDGAGAVKDRGVHQRNSALEHIEKHRLDGIVYFADDDNVYSSELFERLRDINRFGTWPVAMLAQSKNKAILEGPVCNGSQVIGWHTNEKSKRFRRFHVDMSGFAFNSTVLWDPKRWGRSSPNPIRQLDTVKEGFQETTFIEQVVEDESQMEGVPPGCSKILNWHLHLDFHVLAHPSGWLLQKNLDVVLPIK